VTLLRYALGGAARSVRRRGGASLMAMATAGTSLFVLGILLLIATAAGSLLTRWSAAAEFSIFLKDDVSQADRAAIERTLAASGLVAGQAFVSADEALRRFDQQFPDLAAAAASLPANPLPASYDVRLRAELASDPAVDRLADSVRTLAGVSDVRYDRRWIDRLMNAVGAARTAGFAVAAVLIVAACLTITSVVLLALHARRAEIEIMQLVGAPLAYIRGPFVLEGTLLGLGGALAALLALWGVYLGARGQLLAWAAGLVDLGDIGFLPPSAIVGLVAGGAMIGCLGGLLAARTAR
jgi:cell division transport system permease protein